MTLHPPVIIAINLSPASDEVLRQGFEWAALIGGAPVVCHVVPDLSQVRVLFPHLAGVDPEVLDGLRARVSTAVADRVQASTGRAMDPANIAIEVGSPHAGIRAAAERLGAGLIVVGGGGTAARLAHAAGWAVLAARPAAPGAGIVGATDFSDPALPAIELAIREARRRPARLRLLHAIDVDPGVAASISLGQPAFYPMPEEAFTALAEGTRRDLDAALDRFGGAGEPVVLRGPAAQAIIGAAHAEPTALVVVGTHGRSGLRRWLLGSVADMVLRHAPCSVLAVPLGETTNRGDAP